MNDEAKNIRQKVIDFIFKHMRLLHVVPGRRSKWTIILFSLAHMGRILQLIGAFWLMVDNKDNFIELAKGARTMGVNLQGLKSVALLNNKEMIFLLASLDNFWESEYTKQVYINCFKFCKSYRNLIIGAFLTIVVFPPFLGFLPCDIKYPKFPMAFAVFALMEGVQFSYDATCAFCVEGSFLSFSFFIYGQLLLINKRLESIGNDDRDMHKEIVACIVHHNYILQVIDVFQTTYTWAIFIQFFVNTFGICVDIFVFSQKDMGGVLASLFYVAALSAQLAIYCFPAELIIQECNNVSNSIFNSKWYEHPKFSKIYVLNIIQRGNRNVIISGGNGLININVAALTNIFKWTLSLYTLMRDMAKL